MNIIYHEKGRVFHLFNDSISYILMVLPHGGLGSLYYGKVLRDRTGFEHLFVRNRYRDTLTCLCSCNMLEAYLFQIQNNVCNVVDYVWYSIKFVYNFANL